MRSIIHFTRITTHAIWTTIIIQIHRSDKDTRRKKNYKYASMHIVMPQARTSVWKNKRDQNLNLIGNTSFNSRRTAETHTHPPININGSIFLRPDVYVRK